MPLLEAIENIEAPMIENPLPDETLKDAIAASEDIDISKYCQPSFKEASAIARKLGLQGEPQKTKEFAILYPEYFSYNAKSRKLAYTPKPKTLT